MVSDTPTVKSRSPEKGYQSIQQEVGYSDPFQRWSIGLSDTGSDTPTDSKGVPSDYPTRGRILRLTTEGVRRTIRHGVRYSDRLQRGSVGLSDTGSDTPTDSREGLSDYLTWCRILRLLRLILKEGSFDLDVFKNF